MAALSLSSRKYRDGLILKRVSQRLQQLSPNGRSEENVTSSIMVSNSFGNERCRRPKHSN
eukprot:3595362-Amphidinium_carterae.2